MRDDGFSILEALIAIAIVTTAAVSLAQALTVSSRVNAGARVASIAAILAIDKMEQLKAVGWDDPSLQPSPADALVVDTPGYVEYLDAGGAPLLPQPSGPPPAGTVYVRRWLVDPAQAAPNTLALQVIVVRWPRQGSLDVSRLTAARTRAR